MPGVTQRLKMRRCTANQRGVTMIEVLIALVVIAFGLLALIGLQLVSKRNALDATQHSLAAHATHDLLERMRANSSRDALDTYLLVAGGGLGRGQQGAAPRPDCSTGATCSPRQLATFDLWAWEQLLDGASEFLADQNEPVGGFVNPHACLNGPPGGGTGVYRLSIAWRGSVAIPNDPGAPECGAGLDLYGDDEEFRRLLTLETYIVAR